MTAIKRLIKRSTIQAAREPKAHIGALELHRYREDDEYSDICGTAYLEYAPSATHKGDQFTKELGTAEFQKALKLINMGSFN